jgi:hypothetical protein
VTAIGRLVLAPARLLEEDEREQIGHFLAESVHGIDAASEEQAGVDRTGVTCGMRC